MDTLQQTLRLQLEEIQERQKAESAAVEAKAGLQREVDLASTRLAQVCKALEHCLEYRQVGKGKMRNLVRALNA